MQSFVGIPTGTNCVPLIADLLPFSHEEQYFEAFYSFTATGDDNNRLLQTA